MLAFLQLVFGVEGGHVPTSLVLFDGLEAKETDPKYLGPP